MAVIRSASPRRSRCKKPSLFAPSCTVWRPRFSIRSRLGYASGFINAACSPSLALNGKTTCQTKRVLKKSSLSRIESALLQVQLRWAGHVSRMCEDIRMPKAIFFSELKEGKHDRGAPRKRYKDQMKKQLEQAGFSHKSWQREASDRDS